MKRSFQTMWTNSDGYIAYAFKTTGGGDDVENLCRFLRHVDMKGFPLVSPKLVNSDHGAVVAT